MKPLLQPNDRLARLLIIVASIIVLGAIVLLSKDAVQPHWPFAVNVHIFATLNAVLNSTVSVLLILALLAIRKGNAQLHRDIMLSAIILSILFLISYITHHLFAGDTKFGDVNGDGLVDPAELAAVGSRRMVYFIILITHILLAAVILPFILFTAYRGLTRDYLRHKKLARITWPLWLYISITGVVVYWMISPYYK